MRISATKIFKFEMAHQLSSCYSEECKNIHGHGYRLEVTVENGLNADGMIIDFKELKELVAPIIAEFDHQFLTEESFGENPTAENMANYLFLAIRRKTHLVKKIKLWETDTCFVEVSY